MSDLDFQARENRVTEKLKSEVDVSSLPAGVAKEFVEAKQSLQLNVLADSFGGLMGPDSLGAATDEAGARYERALVALEKAVGINLENGSGV